MTSQAKAALGTQLLRDGVAIGGLTNIGGIEFSMDTIDITNHDSVDGYKEFLGGLIETGEVPIEGHFYPGDTNGQVALLGDLTNRTVQSFEIRFPDALATSWIFNAIVTRFKVGDAEVEGALPFEAELKPSGKPFLAITASVGLTTTFFSVSGVGTAIVPTPANDVYEYVVNIATTESSVTITPTASAGTITITANGVTQTVTSGSASAEIALGAAGSITEAVISVQELGKTPKRYTLYLTRAAA